MHYEDNDCYRDQKDFLEILEHMRKIIIYNEHYKASTYDTLQEIKEDIDYNISVYKERLGIK